MTFLTERRLVILTLSFVYATLGERGYARRPDAFAASPKLLMTCDTMLRPPEIASSSSSVKTRLSNRTFRSELVGLLISGMAFFLWRLCALAVGNRILKRGELQ